MAPRSMRNTASSSYMVPRSTGTQGTKAVKSSKPKGVKLATGFKDRALERMNAEQDAEDKITSDLAALRAQLNAGELTQEDFEDKRFDLMGEKQSSGQPIKGLDRELLARVRRGEDVMNAETKDDISATADAEDELDALQDKVITPVAVERSAKRGEVANGKKSRDEIIAELKAQRQAAAEARIAARPQLSDKFKPINSGMKAPKTHIDSKGREVVMIRGEDGKLKKKVRKVVLPVDDAENPVAQPSMLDEGVAGPIQSSAVQEQSRAADDPGETDLGDDDDDIFEGVGTAYDPLGNADDGDSTSDAGQSHSPVLERDRPMESAGDEQPVDDDRTPDEATTDNGSVCTKRDYFGAPIVNHNLPAAPHNPMSDPDVLAAIKRASQMATLKLGLDGQGQDGENTQDSDIITSENDARLRKKAAMLASSNRDLDDMDLGFGGSRFDDDDEDEGGLDKDGRGKTGQRLSEWKGLDHDGADDEPNIGHAKGPKKKKARKRLGDKDSVKDVMSVLERRKALDA